MTLVFFDRVPIRVQHSCIVETFRRRLCQISVILLEYHSGLLDLPVSVPQRVYTNTDRLPMISIAELTDHTITSPADMVFVLLDSIRDCQSMIDQRFGHHRWTH